MFELKKLNWYEVKLCLNDYQQVHDTGILRQVLNELSFAKVNKAEFLTANALGKGKHLKDSDKAV